MKKFWTVFLSVLCAACFLGALVACGEKDDPKPDGKVEYSVTVKSLGGANLKDVTVNFYDGVDRVANGTTDTKGTVAVRLDAGEYDVRLTNLPRGYSAPEKTKTTDTKGTPIVYSLKSEIISGAAPAGYQYSLGDVMYDFTVTTTENKTFKLSEVLKQKKMVLINFWGTYCGPCKQELPFMRDAYAATRTVTNENGAEEERAYKDDVAIIALSIADPGSKILEYQQNNGLTGTFDFAADSAGVSTHFDLSAVPVSVIIDRYGVYCFNHAGSMTEPEFLKLFDFYTSDDYVQDDLVKPEPGGPDIERPKPDVSPVASSVIEEAINGTNADGTKFRGTYHAEEASEDKEYSWPWLVGEDGDGKYLYNSNRGVQEYSFATVYISYTAKKGDILAFDYETSVETGSDNLYVIYNGSQSIVYSGILKGTCFVTVTLEDGDYEVALLYNTDSANTNDFLYDDLIKIRNVRLSNEAEMTAAGESRDLLFDCAYGWNADKNGWDNYVNVKYNAEDGYYHVYNETTQEYGPLLMLNALHGSHWSNSSISLHAVEALDIYEEMDEEEKTEKDKAMEAAWKLIFQYCNYALHSDYADYAPVTPELRDALVYVVANYEENHAAYDSEWLELCVYFEHFGAGEPIADPIKGVAPFRAHPLKETQAYTNDTYQTGIDNGDLNRIVIDKQKLPRGFFYEFTPSESGIYEFRSFGDCGATVWIAEKEDYLANGINATILNVEYEGDGNFIVYAPMYKSSSYYVMLDTANSGTTGTYYVSARNVGETRTVVEAVASESYTTGNWEGGFESAKAILYVDDWGIIDGKPVIINDDDTTSAIYVDLLGGFSLTGNITLAQIFDPAPRKVREVDTNSPVYGVLLDQDGNPVYDEYGNAVLNTLKPVYEFMLDKYGMPVYENGNLVYDYDKPVYNYLYEIKKDANGNDMYDESGNPVYDYDKPVYKKDAESNDIYEKQYIGGYVYDENGVNIIADNGTLLTQLFIYTESEDYEYLQGLIAYAKEASNYELGTDDPLYGMVEVDMKLYTILNELVHRMSDMRSGYVDIGETPKYVEGEWLQLCYYEHVYSI